MSNMVTLKLVGAGERFIPDAGLQVQRNIPFQVTEKIANGLLAHNTDDHIEYEKVELKNAKKINNENKESED